jgi:undecaprenyl-diphosphatase
VDLIQAVVLGVVQGLTEFLPISSTAHIRILPALMGWRDPGAAFTAVIQLGTLVAVVAYFARDLRVSFAGWVSSFRRGAAARSPSARMGWAVVVGTVPIVLAGKAFEEPIENSLRSLVVIAWMLIAMGVLLFAADRLSKKARGYDQVTAWDGVWVGLWQAIALIPGASRSGSTITGALLAGFDRATAARFSFLLSVPAVLIAGIYSAIKHREMFVGEELTAVIVANMASFASGFAAIAFLMWVLRTRSLTGFVVYRILLGLLILWLLQQGVLSPMTGIEARAS